MYIKFKTEKNNTYKQQYNVEFRKYVEVKYMMHKNGKKSRLYYCNAHTLYMMYYLKIYFHRLKMCIITTL